MRRPARPGPIPTPRPGRCPAAVRWRPGRWLGPRRAAPAPAARTPRPEPSGTLRRQPACRPTRCRRSRRREGPRSRPTSRAAASAWRPDGSSPGNGGSRCTRTVPARPESGSGTASPAAASPDRGRRAPTRVPRGRASMPRSSPVRSRPGRAGWQAARRPPPRRIRTGRAAPNRAATGGTPPRRPGSSPRCTVARTAPG